MVAISIAVSPFLFHDLVNLWSSRSFPLTFSCSCSHCLPLCLSRTSGHLTFHFFYPPTFISLLFTFFPILIPFKEKLSQKSSLSHSLFHILSIPLSLTLSLSLSFALSELENRLLFLPQWCSEERLCYSPPLVMAPEIKHSLSLSLFLSLSLCLFLSLCLSLSLCLFLSPIGVLLPYLLPLSIQCVVASQSVWKYSVCVCVCSTQLSLPSHVVCVFSIPHL